MDMFWKDEKVLIDTFDYKGFGILKEQIGDQFHAEIEGREGTHYFRRHEIKKIVGDA